MIHTIDLGVKSASFLLDGIWVWDNDDENENLKHLCYLLDSVEHELVDLTTYRPPAYSWRNNRNTLVLKLTTEPFPLLEFGHILLRCQPNEYQYIVTHEQDVFIRIWWD